MTAGGGSPLSPSSARARGGAGEVEAGAERLAPLPFSSCTAWGCGRRDEVVAWSLDLADPPLSGDLPPPPARRWVAAAVAEADVVARRRARLGDGVEAGRDGGGGGGVGAIVFLISIGAGFRTGTNKIEAKVPTNRCRLENWHL